MRERSAPVQPADTQTSRCIRTVTSIARCPMKSEETQETCRRCGKPSSADQGDHLILTEDLVTSPEWGGIQAWQEITEDDLAFICQPCGVALEDSRVVIYARHCCGCNEPF